MNVHENKEKILTFDNFDVKDYNKEPYVMAKEIAKQTFPNVVYNPVYIYGENKDEITHLAQALRK